MLGQSGHRYAQPAPDRADDPLVATSLCPAAAGLVLTSDCRSCRTEDTDCTALQHRYGLPPSLLYTLAVWHVEETPGGNLIFIKKAKIQRLDKIKRSVNIVLIMIVYFYNWLG